MRLSVHNLVPTSREKQALTVMELLVSVAVMTVIVIGLYSMFAYTQNALRVNVSQVDVLESGRIATGMMARDMEDVMACNVSGTVNIHVVPTTNRFDTIRVIPPLRQLELNEKVELPKNVLRINVLQEIFFLTNFKNSWTGIGYRVMEAPSGVGTLYRYSYTTNLHGLTNVTYNPRTWFGETRLFSNPSISTNLHRVADGVIHLRFTAYDRLGRRLDATSSEYVLTNSFPNYGGRHDAVSRSSSSLVAGRDTLNQTSFFFFNDGLPAYVELELGIFEPEAFKQFSSLPVNSSLANDFLRQRANKVHLFRERIPIRTALQ